MSARVVGQPRAFSLIEVMVALVISAVVLSTVVGVLTLTLRDNRRTRVHTEMLREAEVVTHMLNSELRLAGLGVPRGANIAAGYGTSSPVSFYASLLVGGASEIGVVADLPRPDANFSAFGPLHSRPTGATGVTAVAWHTESNGICMPDGSATSCVVGNDSLLFPDAAAGCTATGTGAAFVDRKCPWGLRRVLPGERIQIVAGDGRWSAARVTGKVVNGALNGVVAAELSPGYPTGTWPNVGLGDAPGGTAGQGFVTTLDRVFYKLEGSTIVRRQCWGDPNPGDPDWPDAATNAVPATPTATGAGSAVDTVCTPAEVVARNVSSLAFSYFDASNVAVTVGATAASKASVRRVDYAIDFARTVDGRQVQQRVTGSVRLTNIP